MVVKVSALTFYADFMTVGTVGFTELPQVRWCKSIDELSMMLEVRSTSHGILLLLFEFLLHSHMLRWSPTWTLGHLHPLRKEKLHFIN